MLWDATLVCLAESTIGVALRRADVQHQQSVNDGYAGTTP